MSSLYQWYRSPPEHRKTETSTEPLDRMRYKRYCQLCHVKLYVKNNQAWGAKRYCVACRDEIIRINDRIKYQKNKDHIKAQHKVYYEKNKDYIIRRNKEYRRSRPDWCRWRWRRYHANHKDAIVAYKHEWYLKNRDRILAKLHAKRSNARR